MSEKDNSIRELLEKIRSPENEYLASKIGLAAFAFSFLIYLLDKALFVQSDISSMFLSRFGAIGFFALLGLDGFVVMVRKKLHQIIDVHGKPAMYIGLIWWLFMWMLALQSIHLLIVDVVKALP